MLCLKLVNIWPKSNDLYKQQTFYAMMFSVGDNVFSHKNAISKNTAEKTSCLPKVGLSVSSLNFVDTIPGEL